MNIPDKKYYIIDGKTGDILRATDDNSGYRSAWRTVGGFIGDDYWTYVQLPEERETVCRIRACGCRV